MTFTDGQRQRIMKLLEIGNPERRLIELKTYLATFQEQLTGDFAQIAYQIYIEHKNGNISSVYN